VFRCPLCVAHSSLKKTAAMGILRVLPTGWSRLDHLDSCAAHEPVKYQSSFSRRRFSCNASKMSFPDCVFWGLPLPFSFHQYSECTGRSCILGFCQRVRDLVGRGVGKELGQSTGKPLWLGPSISISCSHGQKSKIDHLSEKHVPICYVNLVKVMPKLAARDTCIG
jgi:hypothetical protein